MRLVEGYAGMSALTLSYFGLKPPASRIGAKTGYTHALRPLLGQPERFVLVDADAALVQALRAMLRGAVDLTPYMDGDPKAQWLRARERRHDDPSAWWVWTAGARGGIGGFKGKHKLRPSVDGFIPALPSLARRLQHIAQYDLPVDVVHGRAEAFAYAPGDVVYLDPDYRNAQGYAASSSDADVCMAWTRATAAARIVVLSERDPGALDLRPAPAWRPIARRGQSRRSMTTTTCEYAAVWSPG